MYELISNQYIYIGNNAMQVGMIGLGKMGAGLSERLLKSGHQVVGFDRHESKRKALRALRGAPAGSLEELVAKLSPPRIVWLMISSSGVDATVKALAERLSEGDFIIDGGNSRYAESQQRAETLAEKGVQYLDIGASGGIWGREDGYCLMIGGSAEAVDYLSPIFESLAPAKDRGWGRVGPPGAGHYVKMVHNAVEYGLMQAYAEGFALLRRKEDFGLDLLQVCDLWRNGSVVRSWLLDLLSNVLEEDQILEKIEGWVSDSGYGRWAVIEALELDTPVPVMAQAVLERFASRDPDSFAHKLVAKLRHEFGGHEVRWKGQVGAGDSDNAARKLLRRTGGTR